MRKVPLTPGYAHDVRAMVAADPRAGVIYICNPNNPTGTLTSRADIAYALAHKPAGSVLLVDEAYLHLTDAPHVLDMVGAGGDLIVLRTFSKIYGMAGIRCGFAVGRPDLLAKLKPFGMNAMPITGSAAARASLEEPGLVPARRAIIGDSRRDTLAWLRAKDFKVIGDPQTNCFMIDAGRDGKGVIAAMKARNVWIGRTWPVWPKRRARLGGHARGNGAVQDRLRRGDGRPAGARRRVRLASARLPTPVLSTGANAVRPARGPRRRAGADRG